MINFAKKENCTNANMKLIPCVSKYLQEGKSDYVIGKDELFVSGNCLYVVRNMQVYLLDENFSYKHENFPYKEQLHLAINCKYNISKLIFAGILFTSKDKKLNVIQNGDEDDSLIDHSFPTTSFNCLSRLLNSSLKSTLDKFSKKEIVIVDYTKDESIDLTKKQSIAFFNKKISPPIGFSYVTNFGFGEYGAWHRSATVLFYQKTTKKSFILGQDEGTFFGCELVDNPKTIEDAYVSMIPSSIRDKKLIGRQGEWFIVPVATKDVPPITDCITSVEVNLKIDNELAAFHTVTGGDDVRIKDNQVYVYEGCIFHSQSEHADISWNNWATFVHNRVTRSVSQKGVD